MKHENSDRSEHNDHCVLRPTRVNHLAPSRKLVILFLIFFTALGVRLLNWHDRRNEAAAVQSSVVLNYKRQAMLIRTNGIASISDASSSTNDPDLLGHPLGYPILLSLIQRAFDESDTVTQLVQIILDSLAAVIICLIAFQLFPTAVGLIAGLLAAFAPQFSWNSILLLPDSVAALPILLAVFLILVARNRRQHPEQAASVGRLARYEGLLLILAAGALIGVSCWLRANALLLAPFLALWFTINYKRGERLRPALVLVGGAFLIIAPLTIRNSLVFGKFIPLSLGGGQTLIEGIADYDSDGSLGLPQTDMELIHREALTYQRPDYAGSLFTPDGPARDRARLSRGFAVVRAHPFWFASVMVRRAASMMRLERTPLRLETTGTGGWPNLFLWPLRSVQRLFITAIFLPLTLLGAGILTYERQFQSLATLLVVPCYYFCFQSALHTEYRYVLIIHYFFFVLAAVGIYTIACKLIHQIYSRKTSVSLNSSKRKS
ncbi:MAG TPA: glycosyltransferase family 39 protein [Pyrinomonadaceae bacterium]